METVGFLMMSHMVEPAGCWRRRGSWRTPGADAVYVVDSAGAMTTHDARARVAALKAGLRAETQVGIHAHNNLSLAVANSIGALEEGVDQVDGCSRGLGAGAGNCPTEVLVAVSDKLGCATGVDAMRHHATWPRTWCGRSCRREQIIDRTGAHAGLCRGLRLVPAPRRAGRRALRRRCRGRSSSNSAGARSSAARRT